MGEYDDENYQHTDHLSTILFWTNLVFITLIIFVPIGYLIYVTFIIWKRELMPSTNGRMKELVWYFFRIILVFILAWIPGLFCIISGAYGSGGNNVEAGIPTIGIGFLFVALQPVWSTLMAVTKSDVRKYVVDLLTLSYFCRKSQQSESPPPPPLQEPQ